MAVGSRSMEIGSRSVETYLSLMNTSELAGLVDEECPSPTPTTSQAMQVDRRSPTAENKKKPAPPAPTMKHSPSVLDASSLLNTMAQKPRRNRSFTYLDALDSRPTAA